MHFAVAPFHRLLLVTSRSNQSRDFFSHEIYLADCILPYLDIELAPRSQVGVMFERAHKDHGGFREIEMP